MEKKLKIGLLPLFLTLYDQVLDAEDVRKICAFAEVVEGAYNVRGVEVVSGEACRTSDEFQSAIQQFEQAGVDAIVTLHLAYSPSLESIDALAGTRLPVILLDTTPDADFGFDQDASRILFNHGIHGVQDLCNLLIRRGKPFVLEAGHWKESDVIDRTCSAIRGASAALAFRHQRVGLLGKPFDGMGDFAVPFSLLKERFGMEVVQTDSGTLAGRMPSLDSPEVQAEINTDLERFDPGSLSPDEMVASEAAGLALRRWIEEENLSAVTMNFGDISGAPGLPVIPFLEVNKAMERGIGYGGEGDVLTAAFCGALLQAVPESTFTEIFCPDWKGDRIFMSHMGEMNIGLTARRPELSLRPFPFSAADEPLIAAGCFRPGEAVLFNVAPGPDDTFTLVAVPVEVCDTAGCEKIKSSIRGWIKPKVPVIECLERYSRAGGTHHSVLCYGVDRRFAQAFAQVLDWHFEWIDKNGDVS